MLAGMPSWARPTSRPCFEDDGALRAGPREVEHVPLPAPLQHAARKVLVERRVERRPDLRHRAFAVATSIDQLAHGAKSIEARARAVPAVGGPARPLLE